jgi:hypothetical protein
MANDARGMQGASLYHPSALKAKMSANEMGAYLSAWVLWENSSIVFARADTMGTLAVTD